MKIAGNSGKIIQCVFFCILMLCIAFIYSACKKSSIDPVPIDQSYFPLTTGKYIIYDVDSIVFSDFFDTTDTAHYQLMELVDSSFLDASNQEAFRIIRSRRSTPVDDWVVTDIWSANLTENTAEKVEENLRFVKLNFPVLLDKNGKEQSYKY